MEAKIENTSDLIVVEQLPVIVEQLHSIRDTVKQRVADADALACTEETIKSVKSARAELNTQFRQLEERRRAVKKQIMAPYEQFEAVYKECVTDIFAPADKSLAGKISDVENGVKADKAEKVIAYFIELRHATPGLEWLEFEKSGINITLSASMKSLKEQTKAFVDKVNLDIESLHGMIDYADILVEYKKNLNLPAALNTVHKRKMAIAAEQMRVAEAEAAARRQAEAEAKVQEAVVQEAAMEAPVEMPTNEPVLVESEQPERPATEQPKVYKSAFTVYGTLDQLKALKQFLNNGGYRYE